MEILPNDEENLKSLNNMLENNPKFQIYKSNNYQKY